MRISKVTRVWWPKVNFLLCEWIFDLVREHTCRKTRYNFLCFFDVSSMEDIVIDQHVITEESHLQEVRLSTVQDLASYLPLSVREETTD